MTYLHYMETLSTKYEFTVWPASIAWKSYPPNMALRYALPQLHGNTFHQIWLYGITYLHCMETILMSNHVHNKTYEYQRFTIFVSFDSFQNHYYW